MTYASNLHFGPLRQQDIDRRDCAAEEFVLRYKLGATLAARTGKAAVAEFLPNVLGRTADFRNLKVAWSHVARHRDAAPGPDGKRACDYLDDEVHQLLATMGNGIRLEQIQAGPERIVDVPKGPGREGTRPLSLLNVPDRVVHRGVVQMIQPLLDPQFDPHSFGGRPGRSAWQALARACTIAEREGRLIWIAADIQDFFTRIPLGRLWPVVRRYLPDDQLIALLQRLTRRLNLPGLAQGAPLSALLSNSYADHFIDKPWRKRFPDVPLLRFIDDILIGCSSVEDARLAYEQLQRLVQAAGLKLKDSADDPIRDLSAGAHVDYLGYRLTWHGGRIRFALPPSKVTGELHGAWLDGLAVSLERAHEKPDSALRALRTIEGSIDHAGPCLRFMDAASKKDLYRRMAVITAEYGFDEVPKFVDFLERGKASYRRWQSVRRRAARTSTLVNMPMYDNKPPAAVSTKSADIYVLHTDGSHSPSLRRGGWAFRLQRRGTGNVTTHCGILKNTTNNRAELHAVIHGLQQVPVGAAVQVISDSDYVVTGMSRNLSRWKANDWRGGCSGRFKPLKNLQLWQRLDRLLVERRVTCRWVPGHSGNAGNEQVDRLARTAAEDG